MNPEEMHEFLAEEIQAFMNIYPRDMYTLGRMLALYRLRRELKRSDSSMSLVEIIQIAWRDHAALPEDARLGMEHELRAIACLCGTDQKNTSVVEV